MRKIICLAAFSLALALVGTLSAKASLYYSDEHFSFGYNANDGYIDSSVQMDDGTIRYVSIGANGVRWGWDNTTGLYSKIPNGGWINIDFDGVKTPPTVVKSDGGQSLSIDRGTVQIHEGVYNYVYDANADGGMGKGIVQQNQADNSLLAATPPHLFSSASAYFNGSFSVDGYATANYSEYMSGAGVTGFFGVVQIPVLWTGSTPNVPMMSMGTQTTVVPEPASITILVLSGLGLLARRRK